MYRPQPLPSARQPFWFLPSTTHLWITLASVLMVLAGCNRPEPIVTYTIPTELPEQLTPPKDRMLAAILPLGQKVWFFKVTGPENAIDVIDDEFKNFVTSIKFQSGKPILDELPEGWRRGGNKAMRFASIDVTTEAKQLDISISNLGRPASADPTSAENDAWNDYVAMNINRWRGQLGLEASDEKWAGAMPFQVTAADGQSAWFDMTGDMSSSRSMSPPFAGGGPFSSRGPMAGSAGSSPGKPSSASQPDSRLKYDRPNGWRDGRKSSMRWASFNVGPEDAQAEVTVMPAGGELRGNVARWIGQIRGGSPDDDVVDAALEAAQSLKVSGKDAQRFLLTGEDPDAGTAIDATIVPMEGGINMFIKMTGPVGTVTQQSDSLTSFLESLKF